MGAFADRAKRRQAARAFHANRLAETHYVAGLRSVVRGVHKAYMDFLAPRLATVARADGTWRADAAHGIGSDLDLLGLRVAVEIPRKVGPLFDRMAHAVKKTNATRTKSLIGISHSDLGIDQAIAAAKDANIRLVENAARVYAQQVRDVFSDPDAATLTVDELKGRLLERGDVSESRAELIARDQTLKLNGQINQARQTSAGINAYIWSTSLDERVRPEHAELEGQRFDWSSPPAVGHPGQDFQCRCIPLPILPGIDEED